MMRLYRVERVLAIQNSPEFREWLRQEEARKDARKERSEAVQAKRFEQYDRKYDSWSAALPDACEVLFNLTRYTKHDSCSDANRSDIYELKSGMVSLLYEHGYCMECFEHHHELPEKVCFGCDGTGSIDLYETEACHRCNGTGVFKKAKTLTSVCFRFTVGDKTYCWHQPEETVTFKFQTTAASSAWQPEGGDEKPLALSKTKFAAAKDLLRWVLARVQEKPARAA